METNEILNFVKRRFKEDNHWKDGNCYWAAFILCSRFPELQMYYLTGEGHFIVSADGKTFYDAFGKYETDPSKPILLSEIKALDANWYAYLMRDCRD